MSAPEPSRAAVIWTGHRYVVVFRNVEYARFSVTEHKNAQDFANGFNAGLSRIAAS